MLLAIDPEFKVGARVEGTLAARLVTGPGDAADELTHAQRQAVLKPATGMVTLPGPARIPGGIPVGTCVAVTRHASARYQRRATVKPYVDFTALDIVGVVVVLAAHRPA